MRTKTVDRWVTDRVVAVLQAEQPLRLVTYYCMNGVAGIFGGLLGYAIVGLWCLYRLVDER